MASFFKSAIHDFSLSTDGSPPAEEIVPRLYEMIETGCGIVLLLCKIYASGGAFKELTLEALLECL